MQRKMKDYVLLAVCLLVVFAIGLIAGTGYDYDPALPYRVEVPVEELAPRIMALQDDMFNKIYRPGEITTRTQLVEHLLSMAEKFNDKDQLYDSDFMLGFALGKLTIPESRILAECRFQQSLQKVEAGEQLSPGMQQRFDRGLMDRERERRRLEGETFWHP